MAEQSIADQAKQSLVKQQARNVVENGALTRTELESMLKKMEPQIKAALPKHVTVERMVRLALTAVSRQPKLLECTPVSLVGSIVLASQCGLEPNTPLGECHIIPFRNGHTKKMEAQFLIGTRGYQEMALRSERYRGIDAEVVYANDEFSFDKGENKLHHSWPLGDERGEPIGAWAKAVLKDGSIVFETMSKTDILKIKARSKSRDGNGNIVGPWRDDEMEMWKKTAIRRLSKRLSLSASFMKATHLDELGSRGIAQSIKVDDKGEVIYNDITEEVEAEVVDEPKPEPKKEEPKAAPASDEPPPPDEPPAPELSTEKKKTQANGKAEGKSRPIGKTTVNPPESGKGLFED